MDPDEMVTQLSDMLMEIAEKASPSAGPITFDEPAQNAVARECLRQMEWARRMTITIELGTVLAAHSRGCDKIVDLGPLMLAPPEWKP